MKARRVSLWLTAIALVAVGVGGWIWFSRGTEPMPSGAGKYVRWDGPTRIRTVLASLHREGIVRDTDAARLYGWMHRAPAIVPSGTYRLHPGMSLDQIFASLEKPVRQMVRIPETNWASRTAKLLEQHQVTSAAAYLDLVRQPSTFQKYVKFPLPKTSLEGYLYPDTYDLPPLLGAKATIIRQLDAFEKKVWEANGHPANLNEKVTEASLVQLEAGRDDERPLIAGVIQNRLDKGMRLQIDASLLYGIQKWRRLTFDDYKNIKSPYNLYLVNGLPPGPICSPSAKSFQAVLKPAQHGYLYYLALPDGTSLFAKTYEEHQHNIRLRAIARKAAGVT